MVEVIETLDRSLLLLINGAHSSLMDEVMWIISNDFFIYPFIAIFLFASFKFINGKHTAMLLLGIGFCVATADLSTNMIKHAVKRYRPSHNLELKDKVHTVKEYKCGQYGFFSSHAANTMAIALLMFLNSAGILKKKLAWLIFLLPLAIGYSRIYLGVHYPLDIITGFVDGTIVGFLVNWLLHNLLMKNKQSTQK